MMNLSDAVKMPDVSEMSVWTRLIAAGITFVVLAGVAAVGLVFAMMLVLFSADGSSAAQIDRPSFDNVARMVIVALASAVALPPLMMLIKVSTTHSLIPAGLGFVCAGVATLCFVLKNLGAG